MGGQTSRMNYQYLGSPQEGLYPKVKLLEANGKGTTSSKKEMNHYTRLGSGIMTCYTSALPTTSTIIKTNIKSSSSKDGLAALVNKLDNLGRDIKRQDMKRKLKERCFMGNPGPPGYYTKIDNRCHPVWLDRQQREQIKTIIGDQETSGLNKIHGVSFISDPKSDATKVLQHQLPRKELNPGNFTLPCTIGKFNLYAIADLGASINVMPRSIFEHLHLTNLRKINMLCEMADMSKKAPLGIVENILVNIGKFLFLSDFVIIGNTPSETTIMGRPFLATIRAEIDVFARKISLEINEDRISFYSMINSHKYTNPSERIFMVRPQSPVQSNNQTDYEES
ncbi:reverse transcriptase domain-containing protein, partial [Tanacetum coccineum]